MDRPDSHSDHTALAASQKLGNALRDILTGHGGAVEAANQGFWGSRRGTLLAVVLILTATLAAFSNSFSGEFVFDDCEAILDNPTLHHLWPVWRIFAPPADGSAVQRRPVVNASLAVNYAISGTNPWSYHAMNLGIHMCVALLLFAVVRRTLLLPVRRDQWREAATPLALSVAMLWAVHPLLTDAVTYVIQRTEVLAGLFYMLTLYSVIRGSESARSVQWYTAAVVFCALAMGSKEAAISAPLVVLLYDRIFLSDSWREIASRRKWLYVGLAMTWSVILLVLPHGKEETAIFGSTSHRVVQYAMAQCGAITHYLRLCFWPTPLVMDYGPYTTLSASDVIPYLLFITLLLAGTAAALHYRPWLGFLGVWFFAILAPSSSVVPLQQQIAGEKRMYLPLAAVVMLVVVGCFQFGRWLRQRGASLRMLQTAGFVSLALATLGLGATTFHRNWDFASQLSIWEDTIAKVPHNMRAQNNYGTVLKQLGRMDDAIAQYERTLQMKPVFGEARSNYGVALYESGRTEEAIALYREAIAQIPDAAAPHYNLANALRKLNHLDEAMAHYEAAIALKPRYPEAHNNYGMALASTGKLDQAIRQYRLAIEDKPEYDLAYNNLGNALIRQGRIDDAIAAFEAAVRIKPNYADAHNNLGSAFVQRHRIDEAIEQYRKALDSNPDSEQAHANLGAILANRGDLNGAANHFRQVLRVNPGNARVKEYLERLLAQQKEGQKGLIRQNALVAPAADAAKGGNR